ncbi:MAG: GspH/FimT family pseudopilin [Proteobacteria bacterium]|nr:GspH/FimT family pseudopilin [Pseudomonadota bacterium]
MVATTGSARLRQCGLTLVELMVTISILAMLFFLALPDFRAWIQNTRMRTVAEALQNGVRQAQAEAVRRNRTVVFLLTNAEPGVGAVAQANGSNWAMRALPLLPTEAAEFLRGGAFSDVAQGVSIASPAAAICFNPAGQQVAVPAEGCVPAVTNYDVTRAGAERRLRIVVALGGRVRMCDPDKVLSATNPDGC